MSRKAVRNRGREGAHDGILGTDWLGWRGLVLSCTHTTAHTASANTHTHTHNTHTHTHTYTRTLTHSLTLSLSLSLSLSHTHIRELAKKLHLRKTAIFQELIEAGKIPLRPGVSQLVPI